MVYGGALELEQVQAIADSTRGMLAFFALAGQAIRSDGSARVFEILRELVPAARAWDIIEGWTGRLARESSTGWTPELAAAAVVISDCPCWSKLDWIGLSERVAKKPTTG